MRWSDDPRIREGLTSLDPAVPTPCKGMEPITDESLSQYEAGRQLAKGLDIIIQAGSVQTTLTIKRIAQGLKTTIF